MSAGTMVKKTAVLLLVISIIATVICSFVFARDMRGDFSFGTFLLILIGGVAGSAYTYILLHALGSLVEDTNSILSILLPDRTKSNSDTRASTQMATSNSKSTQMVTSNSNFRLSSVSEKGFTLSSVPAEEGWYCQKCDAFNKPTAHVCEQCGKPRQK